jgi:hypothetical protein
LIIYNNKIVLTNTLAEAQMNSPHHLHWPNRNSVNRKTVFVCSTINWLSKIKTTHFREFKCQFKRNVCLLSTIHKTSNYGARLLLLVNAAPAPGRLGRLAPPNKQHQEDRRNLPSLPQSNSSSPRCSKIGCLITPSSGTPHESHS